MADMTRKDMADVLDKGGIVLHEGRFIERHDQIPADTELAGNDEEAQGRAQADLQARIDALIAELEQAKQNAPAMRQAQEDTEGSGVVDYNEMDYNALKVAARTRGLQFPGNISKDGLITLLNSGEDGSQIVTPPED